MSNATAKRVVVHCLVLGVLFLAGCQDKPSGKSGGNATSGGDAKSGKRGQRNNAPILGQLPRFSLTDQTGQAFGSDQLYGKVWVVNFMFTRCTATCPIQTAQMAKLAKGLKALPQGGDVRLVSISVDPETDTPEVLAAYARNHKADSRQWKFLTGARAAIWKLSKEGFKLPVQDNPDDKSMPISHASQFVLVDHQGRIRGYYEGTKDADIAKLRRQLGRVQSERMLVPSDLETIGWLEELKQKQLKTVDKFHVFHGFQFTDQIIESGIDFRHRIVSDAGKTYKGVHYDHGNGVAVADIDGDGLHDLYFVTQVGSNALWKNLGGGKFIDITQQAGVAVGGRICVTASFADIDNDGDADLFVTTVRGGNLLFENDGSGIFQDISKESGLDYVGHSSGAVFFDYNRDGRLDLFLTNVGVYTAEKATRDGYEYYEGLKDAFAGHLKSERNERSILYRNEGGNRFVDVSKKVGLLDNSWSGDASFIDVNEDGWPDLYILNMQGDDEYYENVEGKRFVKKSRDIFPRTSWGAMGIKVFDFNNDGLMDIYITDMHSDMSENIGPEKEKKKSNMIWPKAFVGNGTNSIWGNTFFLNQGSGKFREVSDRIGAENYWPWGLSTGDLNADGFEDAFLTSSMNYPFRYGINSLLLNDRGKRFLNAEFIVGVEPRRNGWISAPWFELDASGEDKNHRLVQDQRGRVSVWGALGSRSSAIFDLDGDGDLDIVTNEFNSEPMVLVSNLSEKTSIHYLKVKLTGTTSNRSGLGAVVKVKVGEATYTKVHDGKSGYLSQSLFPLYFGLGDAESVDAIEVVWPSGQKQTKAGPIKANRLVELTEPETASP